MSIQIEYQGRNYSFTRDTRGVGYWCPTSGSRANLMVPIVVASALRKEAIKQGVDSQIFSKRKPEEERSVRVRVKSKKKAAFSVSLSSLVRSINKFKGTETSE